jgi:hypothetical protein
MGRKHFFDFRSLTFAFAVSGELIPTHVTFQFLAVKITHRFLPPLFFNFAEGIQPLSLFL